MSYLKRFCVDALKIDRSFVQGVTTDPYDAAMVRAMITLAHDLNLLVIAEGIETEAQRAFLNQLRCDEGQGYLFAKPQSAAVIRDVLFSHRSNIQVTPPAFPSRFHALYNLRFRDPRVAEGGIILICSSSASSFTLSFTELLRAPVEGEEPEPNKTDRASHD